MLSVIRGTAGGPSIPGEETFTGSVWRDSLAPPALGARFGRVFFSPGARTHWHVHEGGQVLIVLAGQGFVADADGPVRITVGDMIWTPPGVRHWHGATPDGFLVHTTISLGGTNWHEAVPDAVYATGPA